MLHRLLLKAEEHGDTETAWEALQELSWLTDEDVPSRPNSGEIKQLTLTIS